MKINDRDVYLINSYVYNEGIEITLLKEDKGWRIEYLGYNDKVVHSENIIIELLKERNGKYIRNNYKRINFNKELKEILNGK